jgi:hypothetical protein
MTHIAVTNQQILFEDPDYSERIITLNAIIRRRFGLNSSYYFR